MISILNKVKTVHECIFDMQLISLEMTIGFHDNAIRCVHFSPEFNFLITGSWDSTVKFWDARAPNCLATCSLPDKVNSDDIP